MKAHGDLVTQEKFLRPLARGLSRELARALVHLTADEETQARSDALADKRKARRSLAFRWCAHRSSWKYCEAPYDED